MFYILWLSPVSGSLGTWNKQNKQKKNITKFNSLYSREDLEQLHIIDSVIY
jgi:hypothetical protein